MFNMTSFIVSQSSARRDALSPSRLVRPHQKKMDESIPEVPEYYATQAKDDWRRTMAGACALVRGEIR